MPIGSGDQTTVFGESAWRVHRWQSVLGRKSDDRLTIYDRRGTGGHNQTTIRAAREIRDGTLNLAGVADVYRSGLHPKRGRQRLHCAQQTNSDWQSRIAKNCCSRHTWCNLLKQFQPFPAYAIFDESKSAGVAARSSQARDVAGAHRVGYAYEYNW